MSPFMMRLCSLLETKHLPGALQEGLKTLPHFSGWIKAIQSRKSVLNAWNKTEAIKRSQIHIQKLNVAASLVQVKA